MVSTRKQIKITQKNLKKIIRWYKSIKTRNAIKNFIKNKEYLADIRLKDYYLEDEKLWDYQGLNDDIQISINRIKNKELDIEIIEDGQIIFPKPQKSLEPAKYKKSWFFRIFGV